MSSLDIDNLKTRLHDAQLRLDLANCFSKEIQTDAVIGPDHDEALKTALCAVAEARAEYENALGLFTAAGTGNTNRGD